MSHRSIALTAFEPFDGTGLNASLEGCRAFLERFGMEIPVRFAVLPVEYGRDTEMVQELLAGGEWEILLHTGQSGRAAALHFERVARNRRYPSGRGPGSGTAVWEPIDPAGPESLKSTLPADPLVEVVRSEGISADGSDDAGIYLCNHVLYQSLRTVEQWKSPPRVGFLHVPRLPAQVAQGQPCMTAEEIGRGIAVALRAALRLV